jgi:hypothetical protein
MPRQSSGYAEALRPDVESRLPLIEERQWPTTAIMLNGNPGATISQAIDDAKDIGLLSEKGVFRPPRIAAFWPSWERKEPSCWACRRIASAVHSTPQGVALDVATGSLEALDLLAVRVF